MKKNIRLYNMILPPYMLMAFVPSIAVFSLVGNFIIDSLVLLIISIIIFKKIDKDFYIKSIWRVWLLGFAGDFVGVIYLFIGSEIGYTYIHTNRYAPNDLVYSIMDSMNNVTNHPSEVTFYSICFLVSAIFISVIAIFFFDYFIAFRKNTMTKKQKLLSALSFAVFTAPYTFLLPNELFY